jgi:hypothetical protein
MGTWRGARKRASRVYKEWIMANVVSVVDTLSELYMKGHRSPRQLPRNTRAAP